MTARNIFLFMLMLMSSGLIAQDITPRPAKMEIVGGAGMPLPSSPVIVANDAGSLKVAHYLKDYLKKFYGVNALVSSRKTNAKSAISLQLNNKGTAGGYSIKSDANAFNILGNDAQGLFYGVQSLIQLLPPDRDAKLVLQAVNIEDAPRFGYRGMHLDVCRHFFTVDEVKKYIDYLALNKFNTFHWHLTDDQGWRIEIKKYPLLTKIGSCRAQTLSGKFGGDQYDGIKHCGFFTQAQIKDVVKYATDRYINVIPEIEMPGHAVAALTSYPFLGCTKGPYKVRETWGVSEDIFCGGNDSTYKFLQDVLDEVLTLFPSKYIHIGGDEAPKDRWKECPVCQARIRKEGLKDEHELQSYFVQRIEKYLNSKGRKIIGWDEILEGGLAPNATVMSWRGEEGGINAANQDHDVIMTPGEYVYFDYSQAYDDDSLTIGGYIPLDHVYGYEPIPAVLPAQKHKYILGAQANVWAEYITNFKRVEYTIFPRIAALSEVLWSPKEQRNWKDFERRIPGLFKRYNMWGVSYSKAYYEVRTSLLTTDTAGMLKWKFASHARNFKITVYKKQPDGSLALQKVVNSGDPFFSISSPGDYVADFDVLDNEGRIIHTEKGKLKQSFRFSKSALARAELLTQPSPRYAGSGPVTLQDGVENTRGLNKKDQFLGFNGNDMELLLKYDKPVAVTKILAHAYHDPGSWIHAAAKAEFYKSNDGVNYELVGEATATGMETLHPDYTLEKPFTASYIKVVLRNRGVIPRGFNGAGNRSWLFVDEVQVW